MINKDKDLVGIFQAIDSFITQPDNQFGIIGDLVEGELIKGCFIHITLNSSLSLTAMIDEIRQIQFSSSDETHSLILINEKEEDMNQILYSMNVGAEKIEIRHSGEED